MAFHLNFNYDRIYFLVLIPLISFMTSCGDILNSDENVIKKDITVIDSSGWQKVSFSGFNEISKIFFISPSTGFLLAGDIYQSLDSGKTWSTFLRAIDLSVRDSSVITNFDAISDQIIFASLPTALFKTTNGGKTWDLIQSDSVYLAKNWDFIDSDIGFTADYSILSTSNGGASWSPVSSFLNDYAYYLFAFEKTLIVGGRKNLTIIYNNKSTAYLDWKAKYMDFSSPYSGCLISDKDSIFKTNDLGLNWTYVNSPANSTNLSAITIVDNYAWLSGGAGEIWGSEDGGATWSKQHQDSTYNQITAIHFYNNMIGWAGGRNGMLLRTTTGGKKYASK